MKKRPNVTNLNIFNQYLADVLDDRKVKWMGSILILKKHLAVLITFIKIKNIWIQQSSYYFLFVFFLYKR